VAGPGDRDQADAAILLGFLVRRLVARILETIAIAVLRASLPGWSPVVDVQRLSRHFGVCGGPIDRRSH
jgi:hypothetical protein